MKPDRKYLLPGIFALSTTFIVASLIGPVYGTYSINNKKATGLGTTTISKAVCYFKYSSKKQYYATIEDALTDANLITEKNSSANIKVFVIPGNRNTKVTISNPCTIGKNVTLILPISETTSDKDDDIKATYEYTNDSKIRYFADDNEPHRNTNQKLQVILNSTLTINNGGVLIIGGTYGNDASPYAQGQTTGPYAELLMKKNSSIQCNGEIDCNGYIREDYGTETNPNERVGNDSEINIGAGGVVTEPLIIYDFRGGTASSTLQETVFPFNLFDFPQISPKLNFSSGSILKGRINLYAGLLSKSNHSLFATILGVDGSDNSGLLNSASDNTGTITIKNTDINSGTYINSIKNTNDNSSISFNTHYMDIDVNGHYKFGKLNISVSGGINADSSKYFMPMSNIFHINIKNGGIFDVDNKVKFLPGSTVKIENGAKVNINNDVLFHSYNEFGINDPSPNDYYVKNLNEAVLENGGTVNIGDNSFGGKVIPLQNGKLITSSGFNNTISTVEIVNGSTTKSYSYNAIADLAKKPGNKDSGKIEKNQTLWSSDTYTYKQNNNNETYWTYKGVDQPTVTLSSNVSDGDNESIPNYSTDTSFNLTLSASVQFYMAENMNYTWSLKKGTTISSTTTGASTSFTLDYPGSPNDRNRSDQTYPYTVTLNWSYKKDDGSNIIGSKQFSLSLTRQACVLPGTLITMADGSTKKIEDIKAGEMVLIFNHGTGTYDVAPVSFNDPEPVKKVNVIHCEFDDGSNLGIIDEHGLFDIDLNKYVYIREDTMNLYVGHHFFSNQNSTDFKKHKIVTLTKVYIQEEITACYSITTFKHFNYFTNGLLGLSGGIEGMFNYFDLDKDMKVDLVKMKRDIDKYGLFTYDDFKAYISEKEFEGYNGKYLKVALGKGILTKEKLKQLIERYGGKAV